MIMGSWSSNLSSAPVTWPGSSVAGGIIAAFALHEFEALE